MMIADALSALWIAIVAAVLYAAVPYIVTRLTPAPSTAFAVRLMAATFVVSMAGTLALSALGHINWLTILLLHGAWLAAVWIYCHHASFERMSHAVLGGVADRDNRHDPGPSMRLRMQSAVRWIGPRARVASERPAIAACAAVVMFVFITHVGPALRETRFGHREVYDFLFQARRVLAGEWPGGITPAIAALIAVLATLSTSDPVNVIRCLAPLLATGVAFAIVYLVARMTGRPAAGAAGGFTWMILWSGPGIVTPASIEFLARQHAAIGAAIASLVIVTSVYGRTAWRWRVIDALLAMAVVVLSAPGLIPVAVVALVAPGRHAWLASSMAWIVLACVARAGHAAWLDVALITWPVGAAMIVGQAAARTTETSARPWRVVAAVMFLAVSVAGEISVPRVPVEHDVVAREAVAVAHRMSGRRWTIIGGPLEQIRSYGAARYISMRAFVTCDREPTRSGCARPWDEDAFIFVEKRPFDPADHDAYPGRAIAIGQRLVRSWPGASIYYDDEILRIYHLPPRDTTLARR